MSLGIRIGVVLAVVALTPGGRAQTVRVVGHGGGYASLQAAVDAAKPGDLIELRGYSFAGATIAKGVVVYGTNTVTATSPVFLNTQLTVVNLPQGQQVVLTNLLFQRSDTGGVPIVLSNCKGSVHFEGVQGYGSSRGDALTVTNCAHVTATDSRFYSHAVNVFNRLQDLGGAVTATNSNLSLRRCTVIGGYYSWWNGRAQTYWSTWGISADACRIVAVDSTLQGGGQYCALQLPLGCLSTFGPYAAIEGWNGTTIVVKRVQAKGGVPTTMSTTPGLRGTVIRDPGTVVTVSGTVTVQDIYDLDAKGSAPGGSVPITVKGKGVVPFAVFAGFPSKPVLGGPADIWLSLSYPVLLYADALNGQQVTNITTPKYLPLGMTLCLQAVVLTTRGLESSTPAVLALR